MGLPKCPYMTACCPHYQDACKDAASRGCLYVKQTVANVARTLASFKGYTAAELPAEMQAHLKQFEDFNLTP